MRPLALLVNAFPTTLLVVPPRLSVAVIVAASALWLTATYRGPAEDGRSDRREMERSDA